MSTPIPLFVIAGAILAAFLTGVFSFVGLILSKEQKISEARLAWIESLRSDLSAMLSKIETLTRLAESRLRSVGHAAFTDEELADFREKHRDTYYALEEARNRVVLRLTNSAEHRALLGLVDNLVVVFRGNCENVARVYEVQQQIIRESQTILKGAWRRVKRGEPVFLATEASLFIALFAAVVTVSVWGRSVWKAATALLSSGTVGGI